MTTFAHILSTVRCLSQDDLEKVKRNIAWGYKQPAIELSTLMIAQAALDIIEAERSNAPLPFPPAFIHQSLRAPVVVTAL